MLDKNIIGYGSTIENNGVIDTRIDFNSKVLKNIDGKNIQKINTLCKEAMYILEDVITEISKDEDCSKYIEKLGFKNVDLLVYSDKITSKINMFKNFEKLSKEDKEIEYLEQDPLVNLKTGIIFKDSAALLNPYILTQLIFIYLSKKENVEIYENTEVLGINPMDDTVETITRNKFKIISKNVILTSPMFSLKYLKDEKISIKKTFSLVTERINNLDNDLINVVYKDVSNSNKTISFTKDKRIIITGEDVKQNEKMFNEDYFKHIANGKYKRLLLELISLINLPIDIKVSNCFYGIYIDTKDDLPIIDEIENMPNVYFNLGVGKNGIIYSIFGAKMLKDITKRSHVKDMYLFRENR